VTSFRLAPMSPLVAVLTVGLLALPVVFVVGGLSAPGSVRFVPFGLAGLVALLYLGVWLYARPRAFEVDGRGLAIVWPARRRLIPRSEIAGARVLVRERCRAELGWGGRIGVGGLGGGFGWAWTSKRGLVDLYVSRTDGLVLVERRAGRPLLLTPERPDELVRALRAG